MEFEKILDELNILNDKHKSVAEQIKSHGLPVIVFGAGEMAKWVTRHWNNYGIEIEGYAVDAEFFKPNQQILNRPIYNFAELSTQAEKFVFVLGMEDEMQGGHRAFDFLNDENIISYPLPINLDGSNEKISLDFIKNTHDKFKSTFNMLEDELSRQTMTAFLKLKLTGDWTFNLNVFRPSPYFNELTEPAKGGGYVDCGAYCGDTVERFIKWSGGKYKKIFAVEPEPKNFVELKNFVHDKGYKNITLFNCGVWNEKGVINFESQIERTRASDAGKIEVPTEKLDDILGNEEINFIKLEVQGSELHALKGAEKILTNQAPILSVSIFHKAEDLITIPQFIKSVQSKYKIYIRNNTRIRDNGFMLYAIA